MKPKKNDKIKVGSTTVRVDVDVAVYVVVVWWNKDNFKCILN